MPTPSAIPIAAKIPIRHQFVAGVACAPPLGSRPPGIVLTDVPDGRLEVVVSPVVGAPPATFCPHWLLQMSWSVPTAFTQLAHGQLVKSHVVQSWASPTALSMPTTLSRRFC
jgi:hypothetical protein